MGDKLSKLTSKIYIYIYIYIYKSKRKTIKSRLASKHTFASINLFIYCTFSVVINTIQVSRYLPKKRGGEKSGRSDALPPLHHFFVRSLK